MSGEGAAVDHAAATLRDLDRERYFATLVLPRTVRPAATALYAFSAEIATVRDRVREPAPGEIRLQWWRDALQGREHGEVRQNPLADALLQAIDAHSLPVAPLVALIEARRFDLYHDAMPDLPTFEGYAGETASVLLQLVAMLLGGNAEETADAAGHLGVAQAMTGHLRAFGYNAARGRIFLPMSIFAANGVGAEEILSGIPSQGLLNARMQFVELARDHLARARAALDGLSGDLRAGFAPIGLVGPQLKRIEAAAERPFGLPDDLADWQKLAILAWRGRRQRQRFP